MFYSENNKYSRGNLNTILRNYLDMNYVYQSVFSPLIDIIVSLCENV